jgi:hypothetical protein
MSWITNLGDTVQNVDLEKWGEVIDVWTGDDNGTEEAEATIATTPTGAFPAWLPWAAVGGLVLVLLVRK